MSDLHLLDVKALSDDALKKLLSELPKQEKLSTNDLEVYKAVLEEYRLRVRNP